MSLIESYPVDGIWGSVLERRMSGISTAARQLVASWAATAFLPYACRIVCVESDPDAWLCTRSASERFSILLSSSVHGSL